jgi:predicted TIM-barrel fold metal-dependent hydrolase
MHLFNNRYPFAESATITHADASTGDYLLLQQRLGSERCVVVQPSSYGFDHRVLVAGLKVLGDCARGVAVIIPTVNEEELAELDAHGVVGARFNLVQHGATDESMLMAVAQRIRPLGWHLQMHLHVQDLLRLGDRLGNLGVDVVLDHFARVQTVPELAPAVEEKVRQLLDTGRAWIKFSGAYIASLDAPDYKNLDLFAMGLLADYPDRIVWGSDWPHVTEPQKPDDALLVNLLCRWISSDQLRQRILVENPERLYRFQAIA